MTTKQSLLKSKTNQFATRLNKIKSLLKFDSDEWQEKTRYKLEKEGERILLEVKEFEENKRDQAIFLLKRRQKWMSKYSKLLTMYTDHRSSVEWLYVDDQAMERKLGIDCLLPSQYTNRMSAITAFYSELESVASEIPNTYISMGELEKCLLLCEKVNHYRGRYEEEIAKMKKLQFQIYETMLTMENWIVEAEKELAFGVEEKQ